MTQQVTETAGSVNGHGPAPTEVPPAAGVPTSERAMGVVGVLFGAAVIGIGIDLMTGGAMSRALAGVFSGGDDGAQE